MSGGDASSSSSISFPVFAYPSNIAFVMNEPNSHKQVVTLYNPYEFPLVYKGTRLMGFYGKNCII